MDTKIDKSTLIENLLTIDVVANHCGTSVRTLLLVLAGDMRVINQLSLSEMSSLFEDTAEILSNYNAGLKESIDVSKLEDYQVTRRRAF